MKRIRSAGAVIFRKESKEIKYLLLRYRRGHWDFPRGHIEEGEEEIKTAKREIFEETGIEDLKFIPGFCESYKYSFSGFGQDKNYRIFKENIIYLAETTTKIIKLSYEHHDFCWLPYEQAIRKLTFQTSKEILKKAHQFLLEISHRLWRGPAATG